MGFSAHDLESHASLAAVALGACVLERHVTLDRDQRGPDHKASLLPHELAAQIQAVRQVEAALGVPHRWLTQGELINRRALGKSLVAARDIAEGEVIATDDIVAKSPGLGLSPQRIDELAGRRAARAIGRDTAFVDADLLRPTPAPTAVAVDVGNRWGLVVRFTDAHELLERFAPMHPQLLEFHLSDRDLDVGMTAFVQHALPYELVVHAPEYFRDRLIDLCDADADVRTMSVQRLQRALDLARRMHDRCLQQAAAGPKVVVHVGGMSRTPASYHVPGAEARLIESVAQLETDGVELLLEESAAVSVVLRWPLVWSCAGRRR